MKILVYSQVTAERIQTSLGQPEYSYYFVLKTFLPVLRRLGDVQVIDNPLRDVDPIYQACRERGEFCVFMSFTPPHKTYTGLQCPVIPVFAWEYSTLPDEAWDDGLFNDWVSILRHCAAALTHSSYTLNSIHTALGGDFAATWAPSPVWDKFAATREHVLARETGRLQAELNLKGRVLDSRAVSLEMPATPLLHRSLEEQLQILADNPAIEPVAADAPDKVAPVKTAEPAPAVELTKPLRKRRQARLIRRLRRDVKRHSENFAHWFRDVVEARFKTGDEESAAQKRIVLLEERVHQKEQDLSDKQQEIYTLSDLVRQKESELVDKQNEIYTLGDLVREKESELFAKQNEILRLGRETGRTPDSLELPLPREPQSHTLRLEGVVYTTVFNPADGRKNWRDMVSAFCHTLGDREDATLVLKITHHTLGVGYAEIMEVLQRLAPFRCRVVALWGYLDDDSYQALIHASAYVLNASYGEGQCMPLMEYMSCGVPAVAPDSTALADYINTGNAFVVESSAALTFWQHDARQALRTLHYRPHWSSLASAIRSSYHCFLEDAGRYRQKQQMAAQTLQQYCSQEVVERRLRDLLMQVQHQEAAE